MAMRRSLFDGQTGFHSNTFTSLLSPLQRRSATTGPVCLPCQLRSRRFINTAFPDRDNKFSTSKFTLTHNIAERRRGFAHTPNFRDDGRRDSLRPNQNEDGTRQGATVMEPSQQGTTSTMASTLNEEAPHGTDNKAWQSQRTDATDEHVPYLEHNRTAIPSYSPSAATETTVQSHTLAQRVHTLTDELLRLLNNLARRLNIYTGTDYTPIATLRSRITSQETLVDTCRNNLALAKTTHDQARQTQAVAQKEVVQLLERKHSWSPTDLERYMSLIRSEHEHDQHVNTAAAAVNAGEHALEEARQALEAMERRMYHEEQVWSDTIRRNSSWVTFALMGLNVVLLVGNIIVVEPWRRRRLVGEIRGALDEKAGQAIGPSSAIEASAAGTVAATAQDTAAKSTTEAAVDAATPPVAASLEELQQPLLATDTLEAGYVGGSPVAPLEPSALKARTLFSSERWSQLLSYWSRALADLFSDRIVPMRMVDVTSLVIQGTTMGAGLTAMIVLLFEEIL